MIKNSKKIIEIGNPLAPSELSGEVIGQKESGLWEKNNFFFFLFLVLLTLVLLFLRASYLQIVKGTYFRDVAENNRIRSTLIRAPRGLIKDFEGNILAANVPSYDLVVIPEYLPSDYSVRKKVLETVSKIESLDEEVVAFLEKETAPASQQSYLLKEDIPEEKALRLIEINEKIPGIYISNKAKRSYPEGEFFSQIIGYDGILNDQELKENPQYSVIDHIGKQGVEKFYDKLLRGVNGFHRYEIDSDNSVKKDLGTLSPRLGKELILSLDGSLQKKTTEVLRSILVENKDATGAAAVALDPNNGKIRALVSLPTFNNNDFAGGIEKEKFQALLNDPNNPLLNRAVSGEYPPGSTIKPMVASAALEEGIIEENTIIQCPGHINIGQWSFPDWKTHGATDVKKAIAESCDVFFYAIGGGWQSISGLGIDRMNQYAEMFGLGKTTGIDLPNEKNGLIPDDTWKFKKLGEKWYIGDSYHAAIGQGYLSATPLQLAVMTATLANGGKLFQPTLLEKIIDPQKNQEETVPSREKSSVLISSPNLEIVREGMRQTVYGEKGSGRLLNSLEVESAGKTGTAQFGANDKTHAWYISFAPFDDPELAMVVLIEGGGGGDEWAVPATKEIYQWYFDYDRGMKIMNNE